MTGRLEKYDLTPQFCLYNGTGIIEQGSGHIKFGLLDPDDWELKKRLERSVKLFFSRNDVVCQFEKVSRDVLERIVSRNYGTSREDEKTVNKGASDEIEKSAAVMLLDSILEEAVRQSATDIHIEENCIRFRISGSLVSECSLLPERSSEIVRRIKVLAKMDLMESRKGQDGQFSFETSARKVVVRVSCIPVVSSVRSDFSQSVVMRLLDTGRAPLSLEKLGFTEQQTTVIKDIVSLNSGLVLICGPTGAGKSTTAAAMLKELQTICVGKKKIVTIEDPPEFVLEGISQIKVDDALSMDFDSALRLIFRHDPDVIFIGEIRDRISASTAIRGALTGHLVIATVHTGSFYETILRLCDLGTDIKVLSSTLKAMIQQNLECTKKGSVQLKAKVVRLNEYVSGKISGKDDRFDINCYLEKESI